MCAELELEIPVAVVVPPHPAEDENLPQVVRKKIIMGVTWGNTSLILVPGWQGYEIIYQPHTRAYLVQTSVGGYQKSHQASAGHQSLKPSGYILSDTLPENEIKWELDGDNRLSFLKIKIVRPGYGLILNPGKDLKRILCEKIRVKWRCRIPTATSIKP